MAMEPTDALGLGFSDPEQDDEREQQHGQKPCRRNGDWFHDSAQYAGVEHVAAIVQQLKANIAWLDV